MVQMPRLWNLKISTHCCITWLKTDVSAFSALVSSVFLSSVHFTTLCCRTASVGHCRLCPFFPLNHRSCLVSFFSTFMFCLLLFLSVAFYLALSSVCSAEVLEIRYPVKVHQISHVCRMPSAMLFPVSVLVSVIVFESEGNVQTLQSVCVCCILWWAVGVLWKGLSVNVVILHPVDLSCLQQEWFEQCQHIHPVYLQLWSLLYHVCIMLKRPLSLFTLQDKCC